MKRILVLRGGALGDFIVTLPALRLLRERWPLARIELAGNVRAAELGKIAGLVDAVHSQAEARWAQLYGAAPLSPEFVTWLDGFDLIVSFWPDPDGDLRRHFTHHRKAFIAGDAHTTTAPAAAHFCNALRPQDLTTDVFSVHINYPATMLAKAAQRLSGLVNFVAVHPGSGSPSKNWPLERWQQFTTRLNRPLLVITGEAEGEQLFWPETGTIHNAHHWPLPELGAALSKCTLFVGHDSGVSHLAAASGAKCILLFGPTEPAVWAPPGAMAIRHGSTLDTISVDELLVAVERALTRATVDQ